MHTSYEADSGRRDARGAAPEAFCGCTCGRLRRAARLASRLYDHALRPTGLNAGQFSLLSRLRGENADGDGIALGDLAESLVMDRSTLTRNVRPLQRAGLVEMRQGEDRRTCLVRITKQGRTVQASAVPLWRQAQAEMERSLGAAERKALHASLDHAIARLEPR